MFEETSAIALLSTRSRARSWTRRCGSSVLRMAPDQLVGRRIDRRRAPPDDSVRRRTPGRLATPPRCAIDHREWRRRHVEVYPAQLNVHGRAPVYVIVTTYRPPGGESAIESSRRRDIGRCGGQVPTDLPVDADGSTRREPEGLRDARVHARGDAEAPGGDVFPPEDLGGIRFG